jgi:hypothetical protein
VAGVAGQHGQERRVLARDPYGDRVAEEPDCGAGEPHPQAQSDGGGERAVENGEAARRASEQDGFGQGAMQGDFKAWQNRGLIVLGCGLS